MQPTCLGATAHLEPIWSIAALRPPCSVYLVSMDTECSQPVPIHDRGSTRLVRCRRCPPCLRAAQRYWAAAAANQIRTADARDCRSWFGTCTFSPEVQASVLARAIEAAGDWRASTARERLILIHDEALHEVQKFWKRLRNQGLSFKYIATFEEDGAGRPQVHCLLHETDSARPIRKRELDEGWGLGFTKFRLPRLGPRGGVAHRAIAYVTKSLTSSRDFRLCVSSDYRPERRLPKAERPHQLPLELV